MKSRAEMCADALREVGVLVAVFGPMYTAFETPRAGWDLTWGVLGWIGAGVTAMISGMELERRRT